MNFILFQIKFIKFELHNYAQCWRSASTLFFYMIGSCLILTTRTDVLFFIFLWFVNSLGIILCCRDSTNNNETRHCTCVSVLWCVRAGRMLVGGRSDRQTQRVGKNERRNPADGIVKPLASTSVTDTGSWRRGFTSQGETQIIHVSPPKAAEA